MTTCPYGTLIRVVALYVLFDTPEHLFTSGFLRRCRLIAGARVWTCGQGKLASCGNWSLQRRRYARAM